MYLEFNFIKRFVPVLIEKALKNDDRFFIVCTFIVIHNYGIPFQQGSVVGHHQ